MSLVILQMIIFILLAAFRITKSVELPHKDGFCKDSTQKLFGYQCHHYFSFPDLNLACPHVLKCQEPHCRIQSMRSTRLGYNLAIIPLQNRNCDDGNGGNSTLWLKNVKEGKIAYLAASRIDYGKLFGCGRNHDGANEGVKYKTGLPNPKKFNPLSVFNFLDTDFRVLKSSEYIIRAMDLKLLPSFRRKCDSFDTIYHMWNTTSFKFDTHYRVMSMGDSHVMQGHDIPMAAGKRNTAFLNATALPLARGNPYEIVNPWPLVAMSRITPSTKYFSDPWLLKYHNGINSLETPLGILYIARRHACKGRPIHSWGHMYTNRFVVLDPVSLKPIQISSEFCFPSQRDANTCDAIQVVMSAFISGDGISVTYGINDCYSAVAWLSFSFIKQLLTPVPVHVPYRICLPGEGEFGKGRSCSPYYGDMERKWLKVLNRDRHGKWKPSA